MNELYQDEIEDVLELPKVQTLGRTLHGLNKASIRLELISGQNSFVIRFGMELDKIYRIEWLEVFFVDDR